MEFSQHASLEPMMQAICFAAERHKYLRRSGYPQLPYINHLLKVTNTLIDIEQERDLSTLQAAVLHDILEDTETTHKELAGKFGLTVADIVQELTDDMELSYRERKQLQVEGVVHLSQPAQKIRIADKGCNIEDITTYPLSWTLSRKLTYLDFAIQVVHPLRGTYPKLEHWFDEQVRLGRQRLT